jgi:hypothetical protein
MTTAEHDRLLDITGAKLVEVEVSKDQRVLWINVDGICRLRICQIDRLELQVSSG